MSGEKDDLKKRHDEALAAYERSRKFYVEYILDGFPPPPVMPVNLDDQQDVETWRMAWNYWVSIEGIQERRYPLAKISREELPQIVARERVLRSDVHAYKVQQEYEAILQEIRRMEDGWRTTDPVFNTKYAVLRPIILPILRRIPQSQWKDVLEKAYANTPLATVTPPVDPEALEKQRKERDEWLRLEEEKFERRRAIYAARERMKMDFCGGDFIAQYEKKKRMQSWFDCLQFACMAAIYAIIALLVVIAWEALFMHKYPWWKVFGIILAVVAASALVVKAVMSATAAITWRLGGRNLRLKQLLEWVVTNDMPSRSEALLWANDFHPNDAANARALTHGYYYMHWLSHGRFGNPEQQCRAKEYIAAHEKMGWFEKGREKDVLLDVTKKYFALLDEYTPATDESESVKC